MDKAYSRLLLATDLSHASDAATQKARQLANVLQAELFIAHAIEPIAAYGYPELSDLQSPLIDNAKTTLSTLAQELNVPTDHCFIEFGPVKKIIPELAAKHNVDLIILGSHGHHGIARLLGSSANAIAHHTDCDTLIVHNLD